MDIKKLVIIPEWVMVSHNGTENKYTEIEYARYELCCSHRC